MRFQIPLLSTPTVQLGCWRRISAAVLTLGLTAGASSAESSYFSALESGNTEPFANTPAVQIRTYVMTAFARLERECPNAGTAYKRPWNLAEYLAKMPVAGDPATAMVVNGIWVGEAKKVERWSEMAKGDVAAFLNRSGCKGIAQQAWVSTAKKMLEDPLSGGPFPQAKALCEESGAKPDTCDCFANDYDMESTPRQRRSVLDGKPPIEGLRTSLRDRDLAIRATYKCHSAPAIANPQTEYMQGSDEKHRLKDGSYLMFHPRAARQGNQSCNIKRRADWRYDFSCLGMRGVATMSQGGDTINVNYGASKAQETYSVLAGGTLRLRSSNSQMALDLMPPGETTVAGSDGVAQGGAIHSSNAAQNARNAPRTPVKRTMKAGECGRMERGILRARQYPGSIHMNSLKWLEADYQVNCFANP